MGAVGNQLVRRREIDQEARARRREVADALLEPLRWLLRLARSGRYSDPSPALWAEAVVSFQRAFDDAEHLLPDGAGHISRSALAAVGEHAGSVMFADLDPRVVDDPPPLKSPEWLEYAIGYLEYVVFKTQSWRDGRRASFELERFDNWLTPRRWQPNARRPHDELSVPA